MTDSTGQVSLLRSVETSDLSVPKDRIWLSYLAVLFIIIIIIYYYFYPRYQKSRWRDFFFKIKLRNIGQTNGNNLKLNATDVFKTESDVFNFAGDIHIDEEMNEC